MKMEFPVLAPCDGAVLDISVAASDTVQLGAPLALLRRAHADASAAADGGAAAAGSLEPSGALATATRQPTALFAQCSQQHDGSVGKRTEM